MRTAATRSLYKMLKSKLAAANFKGTVQESYLLTLSAAANGKSVYEFDTQEGVNSVNYIENRINSQDALVVTHIGMRARNIGTAAGNLAGCSVPQTYNNATIFPNETSGFQTADLASWWNGRFVLQVGDTTYKKAIPTRRCWYVPQTQQSAATNRSQVSEYDGLIALDSPVILKGSSDNGLSVVVPSTSAAKVQYTDTATSGTVYMEIYALGYLITGGDKVNFAEVFGNANSI